MAGTGVWVWGIMFCWCKNHLIAWCIILVERLIILLMGKKLFSFYEIQRFIIVFTKSCHWTLSWFSWFQLRTSQPIFLTYTLILSFRTLSVGLFPSVYPPETPYIFLIFARCYIHPSRPAVRLILFHWSQYALWSSAITRNLSWSICGCGDGFVVLLSSLIIHERTQRCSGCG